ncbi:hypothetical protein EDC96DRAFT_242083 [Choanephora cucurbitarum]|nr:hypothetical protein EDC96DRAFT_242083 [Choanephora cucurbitarum]
MLFYCFDYRAMVYSYDTSFHTLSWLLTSACLDLMCFLPLLKRKQVKMTGFLSTQVSYYIWNSTIHRANDWMICSPLRMKERRNTRISTYTCFCRHIQLFYSHLIIIINNFNFYGKNIHF